MARAHHRTARQPIHSDVRVCDKIFGRQTSTIHALALEYQVADQMLKARARAGLTQDAVAERMGTTKSAISRLESASKHLSIVGEDRLG